MARQTDLAHTYYAGLRDRFLPGKPMWVTETADAAAGGNPWAATFTDTFGYLYAVVQRLRAAGRETFSPRPNYWAGGDLPQLAGTHHPAGSLTVQPGTIEFLTTAS